MSYTPATTLDVSLTLDPGWLIGPPALCAAALAAHSRIVFCTNTPLQEAVAYALEEQGAHNFFPDQLAAYTERRDILCGIFDKLGLSYTKPQGAYYLMVDFSPVKVPEDYPLPESCQGRGEDFRKAWWLAQEIKVAAIPISEVSAGERARARASARGLIAPEEDRRAITDNHRSFTPKTTPVSASDSSDSPSAKIRLCSRRLGRG